MKLAGTLFTSKQNQESSSKSRVHKTIENRVYISIYEIETKEKEVDHFSCVI